MVSAEGRQQIERMRWLSGTMPIDNEATLIANLRATFDDVPSCERCGRNDARICGACARIIVAGVSGL